MGAQNRSRTVGAAVLDRIGTQAAVLDALDEAVRVDEPDAVHRMRVACRRLRSALRTFRRVFAAGATDELVTELRWLGAALGRARDREVLGERLVAQARELPAACGPDRVAGELERWSAEEYRRVWPEVVAALDSPRRRALGDGLAALLADPPLRGRAGRPAGPELARIAAREQRRTAERVRAALAEGPADGPAQDRALHEARKAAKRARYAGETAVPAVGRRAERYVERMKAVQEVLGEHQDAVVAEAALREQAEGSGEAFGYGVLYAWQLAAGAAARRELPAVWAGASGRKLARFG
ncbi:CHAD domain-containing protein [Kitasatospora sp. CM 4170]|uniref:CHAD domain-containing protein n=1 Tax=Kitasatospora aburaviensis TaxID=67265 RepID=A0ABW1ERG7_9ACTN|nr:CHAD domain-containing protein [Kitasatospora sp. CM 4170]WNM44645.1 CHAD domain-containing protein [Kitasatospora sp. CM 4170]